MKSLVCKKINHIYQGFYRFRFLFFIFFTFSHFLWQIMMILMMMMMMDCFCGMEAFSLISSREIFTIANLHHAESGLWTRVEPKSRLSWIKLCNSDNHYTTAHTGFQLREGYTVLWAANRFVGSETPKLNDFDQFSKLKFHFKHCSRNTRFLSFEVPI